MQGAPMAPPSEKICALSPVTAPTSWAEPPSPVTIRKSSCRPISFGIASPRSSTTPGNAWASAAFWALSSCGVGIDVLERFGADQALGQQHGDGLAALEHHGDGGT